jgi:hypothetical protein
VSRIVIVNKSTTPSNPGWFKASFSSQSSSCVEVRFAEDEVLVRDSKYHGDPTFQPMIAIPAASWHQFLAIATGNATDDGAALGIPTIEYDASTGHTTLRDAVGTTLEYTTAEWAAFTAGAGVGEFAIGLT